MKSSTQRTTESTPLPRDDSPHASPELRIDPGHVPNTEAQHAQMLEEDQGVDLTAADLETLPDWQRRQINQLARLMRDRQVDLDRREAELNARLANVERQERRAAFATQLGINPTEPETTPPPAPQKPASSNPLRSIEEKIQSWRRKWRGQSSGLADEASADDRHAHDPLEDAVAVRLEKLAEAEAQLAQQWALLKNARSLQALREKEFAGYTQQVERELEQSRAQQHRWLEREQEQLAQQQEDLDRRESGLAGVQEELELAFEELQAIRDQLEMAWAEIRVRIPSALRRRLDQQTDGAVDYFDKAVHARNQSAKLEIRHLLHQLELAKLDVQEQQVQLEDDTTRQQSELRRAKRDLVDRETQVRAQLSQLRKEHESLNDSKLDILKERYRELSREIMRDAA